MNIAFFGCGYIFNKFKNMVSNNNRVLGILDNNYGKIGKEISGYVVRHPSDYNKMKLDLIVIMSDSAISMRKQLLELGCPENLIIHYKDYLGKYVRNKKIYHSNIKSENKAKLLIISNELGYHGGSIAAIKSAQCAISLGYDVTIASSEGDSRIIKKLNDYGINVVIQIGVSNADWQDLYWVNEYDKIVINTFPMINCAIAISQYRKTIVWLHESADVYDLMEYWHDTIQRGINNTNISIYYVTKNAYRNFCCHYSTNGKFNSLLPPVEDCFDRIPVDFTNKELTYAVIATICENKRQDFYINTIIRYNKIYGAMHLIIGKIGESAYSKRVEELASNYKSINLMGEKTLDELEQIWNKIDIVVVPSYAETFSLVAAEAMMRSKICIVSNNCGISDYIVNGENGFVFECDNMAELAEKWIGVKKIEAA